MKYYRLKKEAVPFFKEKHATSIYPFDTWDGLGVDINALEEVDDIILTYGHKDGKNSSSLSGWNNDDGTYFYFTIKFPSVKWSEHDRFSNGKETRELMNKIQAAINSHYIDFVNELKP